MKKIIVPIDFSEYSENALETASGLARKYNAEIFALHMLELSNAVLTSSSDQKDVEAVFYMKLAEKKFKNFLEKDYLDGLKVTPIVKHFKVFSEVNEVAKENGADLIDMGSHGVSGLKEVIIGSNTEKVVRHSDIPVLVVKHNPILTDFDNVVFACDFSDDAIKPYINATKMLDSINAKLHLLYVNVPDAGFRSSAEMEKKVADFLKRADGSLDNMKNVTYVSDYTIEEGILNFSNVLGADLIAIATHGRTGLAHFFEGSITEDIANHSTLPVMTFKI